MNLNSTLGCAIVFAIAASVCGQDKATTTATTAAVAAPSKPAASAGLANDWLRQQSEAFKAWDIGGEFRARYDFKENAGEGSSASVDFMKVPPAGKFNDNHYLSLREKFHIGYTGLGWFNLYAEARDSSTTGDRRDPNKGADQFDLHQGYLKLGNAKKFPLTAKVGRQELVYGDERMIGRSDWNNLGRVFDAGVLRFENPVVWVDAFAGRIVMPVNHHFNLPNDYDWLSGVYASTRTLVSIQESQFYFLAHNVSAKAAVLDPSWLSRPCTPQDTYTAGLRFKSLPDKLGAWDYTFEAAVQFGNVQVKTTRLEQEAFAVMASGGYTWKETWGAPRLGVGYDFFSGESNPADNRNETFEPLFPTNHKPLGLMDLVGAKNIHDPRLTFCLKPAKPVTVNLEWHSYFLADTADYFYNDGGSARNGNGYVRNPQLNSYAGSELDLDVIYTFKPWAGFRAGYGHFFVGNYVQDSLGANGGSQDADWFYAQLTFAF
jgi:hypothetical protein